VNCGKGSLAERWLSFAVNQGDFGPGLVVDLGHSHELPFGID
jgi:hypothetical protein